MSDYPKGKAGKAGEVCAQWIIEIGAKIHGDTLDWTVY